MCVLALDDLDESLQEKISVVDLEVRRSGPTFAIETIHQLRAFFPLDSYTLILGTDAASNFDKWHRSADLKKLVDIVVVRRPGESKSAFPEVPLCAYQVSGEYAMLKFAAQAGLINETDAMMESIIAIKRAGADLIITYFAKDIAGILNNE